MDSFSTFDSAAYVDEAGVLGYTRRLTPANDDQIGLFAATVIPAARLTDVSDAFEPAFTRFKEAAPPGAKLHIADAFAPGNEAWARVATSVRGDAYDVIRHFDLPIIFEAKRLSEARQLRDSLDQVAAAAIASRRSAIQVKHVPFNERVEELLLEMLLEQVDLHGEDFGLTAVEVRFDEVARGLLKTFRRKLLELRSMNDASEKLTGYDPTTGTIHHAEIRTRIAGVVLDVPRIAELTVAGMEDPLVLLVDIVANSLNAHLGQLDPARPVDRSSAREWCLEAQVWPAEF